MPENEIPLMEGEKASSDSTDASARTAINWMVDGDGASVLRPAIVNTQLDPGKYAATSGTNTGIAGVYAWKNVSDGFYYAVYVRKDGFVFGKNLQTNLVVSASSSLDPTTQVQNTAPGVTFTEDTQRLIIAGGGQLQQWTGVGLSSRLGPYTLGVTQPPLAATHVVNLAGYIVANQTFAQTAGQILWSNLGDGSHITWNPLNFNTADADPDPIVSLSANLRELAAFGTKTMQVFAVGADPTLPFVAANALSIGCSAPYGVVVYDGRYIWLDDNRRFVESDGRSYQVIAPDINKLVRDFTTVSDCRAFRLQAGYWDAIIFVFPTAGRAWAYDVRTKEMYPWRGWNGADDFGPVRIGAYAHYAQGGLHIVGDPTYENLWTLDVNSARDSGPDTDLVADRITRRLDWGTSGWKCSGNVRVFVKRGTAPQSAASSAFLECSKNDDDGGWTTWKRLDLGKAGDSTSYADWKPGGIYCRRQYRFRYSAGIPLSITRAVETWEPYL